MADALSLLGVAIEIEVGPPAHGGVCVARHDGRVVFVRHALPGERVRAVVTDDSSRSYLRADAIEVLRAAVDRVKPPCRHAGPGRCGGCDWQHASGDAQRELKATVIREQFARLAGLDVDSAGFTGVEELPGGLLGWRSRITFAVDARGRLGLRRHRSHDVVAIESCPLGVPGVGNSQVLAERWDGRSAVEVVRSDDDIAVIEHRPGSGRQARGRRPPDRLTVVQGPASLRHHVGERTFAVAADGFWQVHPHAVSSFAKAVIAATAPRPGETVLDLYAGAGALTGVLAEAVGESGRVVSVESSPLAVSDAIANLGDLPAAQPRRGRVTPQLLIDIDVRPDVVVLDPPRAGAGVAVMAALLALQPRCVAYMSCDPATLARDTRAALDAGWQLAGLRAFDAFPMTHHVECLALLTPVHLVP